jgi:hypothetical protein
LQPLAKLTFPTSKQIQSTQDDKRFCAATSRPVIGKFFTAPPTITHRPKIAYQVVHKNGETHSAGSIALAANGFKQVRRNRHSYAT